MQYARYGKPTGTSMQSIKKGMRKTARLPPFTPNRKAKQMLNRQEMKFFDTTLSFNCDATAEVPATGQLALIVQGTGNTNREGYLVTVKSIQIRGVLSFAPGAAATAASNAIIQVMLDRQPNGAAAAVTDALTTTVMSTGLPVVPNQYRFKTLKRIVVPVNSQAGVTTAYNNFNVCVDEYIKLKKPIEIRYNGNAGTVADLTTNNLFLFAGSDGSTDDTISFAGTARLRFTG